MKTKIEIEGNEVTGVAVNDVEHSDSKTIAAVVALMKTADDLYVDLDYATATVQGVEYCAQFAI